MNLFGKTDPIDELGFQKSQIAVLRLNPQASELGSQLTTVSRAEIDQEDFTGRTALSWAAQRGDIQAIQILLMKGADPNRADVEGKTPFSHCDIDPHCLRILLEAGAHVNHTDKLQNSKFSSAITQKGCLISLDLLLNFGADINHPGRGSTPLQLAISYAIPSKLKVTEWLLERGVNVNTSNRMGESALLDALKYQSPPALVKRLLERGVDHTAKNQLDEGPLHYVARYEDAATIHGLRLQDLDFTGLSAHEPSRCGLVPWVHVPYGKTAMELAVWRRDRNEDWAIETGEKPDPDPHAWFEAFESFVRSIANKSGSAPHNGISCPATSVHHHKYAINAESTRKVNSGTMQSQSHHHHEGTWKLELPGSFPQED